MQQENGGDACGFYISVATDLCNGVDSTSMTLEQSKTR